MNKSKHSFFTRCLGDVLEILDTGISLGVYLRMKYQVSEMPDILVSNYLAPDAYLADAQAVALLKKNPWYMASSEGAAAKALEKFLACEEICRDTNRKSLLQSLNFKERSVIETARHFAARILGDFYWSEPDFGPGASYSLAGDLANYIAKLGTLPECTPVAHRHVLKLLLEMMPHYCLSSGLIARDRTSLTLQTTKLPLVRGNRFMTVPKTVEIDRPICVEPLGNMLAQKSIGKSISHRLGLYGIRLDEQTDYHRSIIEHLDYSQFATIDLSSASDTISWAVVKMIIPHDWFTVMDECRSHYTLLPNGSWMENEKFSSMGNGFTFELETLIFYSLALATRYHYGEKSHIVSVFGDDIIVHPSSFDPLISLLGTLGFTPNYKKSFKDGCFRESCGYDGWYGIPVRPIYIKEFPDNEIERLYKLANRVSDIARNLTFSEFRDSRFRGLLENIIRRVPRSFRFFGPTEFGDQVLPPIYYFASKGRCKVLERISRRKKLPSEPSWHLACALYGLSSSGLVTRTSRYTIQGRYRDCLTTVTNQIWV